MTMAELELHSESLNASRLLSVLRTSVDSGSNDARWLRERQADERLLPEVIRQSALRFAGA